MLGWGDYSALVMLGVDRQGVLYVEADLARRPTPQMVADGAEWFRKFRPDVFGVEANQFQDLLAGEFESEFRRQGILGRPARADREPTSKQVRIRRLGPYLSSRRLRFKANSPARGCWSNSSNSSPSAITTTVPTRWKWPCAWPPKCCAAARSRTGWAAGCRWESEKDEV